MDFAAITHNYQIMAENNGDRLKQRVIADVDSTIHAEIVSQLLTVIECPILNNRVWR